VPTIAYLTNLFPSPLESYVVDEIHELRKRGINVLPCSVRRGTEVSSEFKSIAAETQYLQPLQPMLLIRAAWLCVRKFTLLREFLLRILVGRSEPLKRRLLALLHTGLGAYYALLLEGHHVVHIHVHHGYFGSWVAMVAARLLDIPFSMTLHGSDLLLHAAYLDLKLKQCSFCVTISEFNRNHILEHYPEAEAEKIIVQRMGVNGRSINPAMPSASKESPFAILTVGRLHPVKNHAFLVRACCLLKDRGFRFVCLIAGEGPERQFLKQLIDDLDLGHEVTLLGHRSHCQLGVHYRNADLVVLTSRSEGIPLALMEAMARGRPVLAPSITGIPELIMDGKTGFLYQPGSLDDFVTKIELISGLRSALAPLCRAARQHVLDHFDQEKNLRAYCDFLVSRLITSSTHATTHF